MVSFENISVLSSYTIENTFNSTDCFNESSTMLAEAVLTSTATELLKKFVGKVRDVLRAVYNRAKTFINNVIKRAKDFANELRKEHSGAKTASKPRWNSNDIEDIIANSTKVDFDTTFSLHDWDDKYIDSLPYKMDKIDEQEIHVNGRRTSFAADELAPFLQYSLDNQQFEDVLDTYQDEVVPKIPKILGLHGRTVNQKAVYDRAGGSTPVHVPVSKDRVIDMIRTIENMDSELDNITSRYNRLDTAYKRAEHEIDKIAVSADLDSKSVFRLINNIRSILQNKTMIFNMVNSAHTKAIVDRSNEYIDQLHEVLL